MCEIDIIIPTTGKRPQQLLECLNSLQKQTLQVNIVLVFGTQTRWNEAKLHQFLNNYNYTILLEPHKKTRGNRAIACNFGLKNTYHEYAAFLDDDTTVPSTWAEDALKHFKDPRIAGVTSGCNPSASPFHLVQTIGSDAHSNTFTKPTSVESIPGYNSIYLRKTLDLVGGFDERLGSCEDWELNYRLRKAGYILLGIPETPVEHRHSYTYHSFIKQMFSYGWGRAQLLRKAHIFTPQHALPTAGLLTLAILLFLNPEAFLVGLGVYGLLLIGVTHKIHPLSPKSFTQTYFTFILMHLSWALGYLKGLIA